MILIVDQNREGRDGVRRLLTRVGYRVECVGTGAEAMAYLRMVRPSAVLIGASPASHEALDVLLQMRQDPRMAAVPVFVMSDGENAGFEAESMRMGAMTRW